MTSREGSRVKVLKVRTWAIVSLCTRRPAPARLVRSVTSSTRPTLEDGLVGVCCWCTWRGVRAATKLRKLWPCACECRVPWRVRDRTQATNVISAIWGHGMCSPHGAPFESLAQRSRSPVLRSQRVCVLNAAPGDHHAHRVLHVTRQLRRGHAIGSSPHRSQARHALGRPHGPCSEGTGENARSQQRSSQPAQAAPWRRSAQQRTPSAHGLRPRALARRRRRGLASGLDSARLLPRAGSALPPQASVHRARSARPRPPPRSGPLPRRLRSAQDQLPLDLVRRLLQVSAPGLRSAHRRRPRHSAPPRPHLSGHARRRRHSVRRLRRRSARGPRQVSGRPRRQALGLPRRQRSARAPRPSALRDRPRLVLGPRRRGTRLPAPRCHSRHRCPRTQC